MKADDGWVFTPLPLLFRACFPEAESALKPVFPLEFHLLNTLPRHCVIRETDIIICLGEFLK